MEYLPAYKGNPGNQSGNPGNWKCAPAVWRIAHPPHAPRGNRESDDGTDEKKPAARKET